MIRRLLGILAAGAGLAAGLGLYARYVEPKRVQVQRIDVGIDGELTVAFVTDTHIGPHFSARDLEHTVRALEQVRPDVVLFGGDFLSESPRYLLELEAPLRKMAALAKVGAWGIWGNHDLANIRSRIEPVLERCGITMLTNQSVQLPDSTWIVGIDDALLGKPDIAAAFAGIPDGAKVICLWHEADLAAEVAPFKPTIMLSGHTHGGQVRLPVIGPLATPSLGKRYVAGRFDVDGMPLYVSRGIGIYRPPVRFHCRPELVVFRA